MKKIIKNYFKFYKENLKAKHIVCTIVFVLLFIVLLVTNIANFSKLEQIQYEKVLYFDKLKENLLLSFVIIFAGITPYVYLSVLGFCAVYNVAVDIAVEYASSHNALLLIVHCIVALVIAISYSLSIATGIYYCTLSTRKRKYSQRKNYSFNDVKIAIYRLRKNEEKVQALENKKKEKKEKIDKLNVNVPYRYFFISYVITVIMLIVTTLVI